MGQPLRRLARSLGWTGWIGLVLAIVSLTLPATPAMLRVIVPLVAGLVVLGFQWGVYRSPVHTRHYPELLDPLLASREEFLVILRPFGSDGEVLLPYQRGSWYLNPVGTVTPMVTLEQVVAAAARSSLGVRAFAIVDQTRELAPPGPVYLRAGMDEWRTAAAALIRRAHTIAVILPPHQRLRESMEWEIREIVRAERTSRVVVLLPPYNRKRYDHPELRRQAALLLTALESGIGRLTQLPGPAVEANLERVPETAMMVKIASGGGVLTWSAEGRRRRRLTSKLYTEALGGAIEANEREMQQWGFRARYPGAGVQ